MRALMFSGIALVIISSIALIISVARMNAVLIVLCTVLWYVAFIRVVIVELGKARRRALHDRVYH